MKINDFGEKIGGARKDLWNENGLSVSDLRFLNDAEKQKYVTKNHVWPMPTGKKQVESGTDVFVAFWQRQIRNLAYTAPRLYRDKTKLESIENYVEAMGDLRSHVMACRTLKDIETFEAMAETGYDGNHWQAAIYVPDLRSLKYQKGRLMRKMQHTNFPEGKPTVKKKRKSQFVPPQLTNIERTGVDYRHGRHVSPKRWQDEFCFRGVEFGNWCSQKDRQVSMDMCYDALRDLASALRIRKEDIAFGGSLALAFGARGHSSARAHYEPLREVINLTKMSGAGCTAHEWAHALDDRIGKQFGCEIGVLASEAKDRDGLPKSFVRLVDTLQKDGEGNFTDFYRGSRKFDAFFSKDSHGYWSSLCEMFARAFACYVKDTLEEKSDYLYAHADCYEFEFDNQSACAIPQGEEREILDEMFDLLFCDLREMGFFHDWEEETDIEVLADTSMPAFPKPYAETYEADEYGQFLMVF